MTDATRTRYCGNCGKEVGPSDVVCPHCDALLAAYEAPSGASDGTSAAVMPVDMSTPSTTPPAQPTYAAPTRIEVPPPASPTATAIAETKAAADAAEPSNAGDPDDDAWPISSQPVSDALTDTIEVNEAPAPHPSPVSRTLADTRKKVDTHPAPSVAEIATPQPQPTPEPGPTPPVVTSSPPAAHPAPERLDQEPAGKQTQERKKMPAKDSRSAGQTIFFILIAVFIFSRISGGTAFFGTIITFVAIGVVIWFIVRITNATGRKTTSMPWDDQFRKRRR